MPPRLLFFRRFFRRFAATASSTTVASSGGAGRWLAATASASAARSASTPSPVRAEVSTTTGAEAVSPPEPSLASPRTGSRCSCACTAASCEAPTVSVLFSATTSGICSSRVSAAASTVLSPTKPRQLGRATDERLWNRKRRRISRRRTRRRRRKTTRRRRRRGSSVLRADALICGDHEQHDVCRSSAVASHVAEELLAGRVDEGALQLGVQRHRPCATATTGQPRR